MASGRREWFHRGLTEPFQRQSVGNVGVRVQPGKRCLREEEESSSEVDGPCWLESAQVHEPGAEETSLQGPVSLRSVRPGRVPGGRLPSLRSRS